jgi:hypothetical protein
MRKRGKDKTNLMVVKVAVKAAFVLIGRHVLEQEVASRTSTIESKLESAIFALPACTIRQLERRSEHSLEATRMPDLALHPAHQPAQDHLPTAFANHASSSQHVPLPRRFRLPVSLAHSSVRISLPSSSFTVDIRGRGVVNRRDGESGEVDHWRLRGSLLSARGGGGKGDLWTGTVV